MNVTVVYDSQSSTVIREHNRGDNKKIDQAEFVSDLLQCKNNKTTHIKYQKHPIPGNNYIFFKVTPQLNKKQSVPK